MVKQQNVGLSKEQVCVFVSRDRNKNTFYKIFDSFIARNLADEFLNIIDKDVLFCSDSKSVFKKFVKENNIIHGVLNSSKGERVKREIVHIQNINSYHSKLKGWIDLMEWQQNI